MLRLEKLEVCGFKSFGDRAEIQFPAGVTGIVGPNGCGKSNIGDAINWVLGEQSAKMLRGQNMADVIFGGSEARKPLGMAEVTLVFGGAEGIPQADQGRVVVCRRLFRTGESEYRLNGVRTRLKDIQDLLRQSRIGARTYATIEQGKIEQVLNAKPKDRRALIEDAAGISGYKHKRRLAELRLEATHANLLRVNDIVTEVQRQINSLKRQAAKARRYRRLRDELRNKELIHFTRKARHMDRELVRLRGEEGASRDAESEAAARLARLEASLTEQREVLEKANNTLRETSGNLHRLDIEIDRQEGQIRTCRERIDEANTRAEGQQAEERSLATRLEDLVAGARTQHETLSACRSDTERISGEVQREQGQLAQAETAHATLREEIEQLRAGQFAAMSRSSEMRNRTRSVEEALERARQRRERLESERVSAQDDLSRIESTSRLLEQEAAERGQALDRRRAELERDERALREMRELETARLETLAGAQAREESARSRLATLEDVNTRFAGVSDGVKTLLAAGAEAGIRTSGVVADYVEASREIEGTAEGYLHALLPTVILDSDEDAQRAAELLRRHGAGRTSLISKAQPAGALAVGTSANGRGNLPPEILDDRRVLGRLRDKLNLKTSANGVIAERIGDAVLVDSLAAALDLHRQHAAADYLTPTGEIVYASGVIAAGGAAPADAGLLAHRRSTEHTRGEVADAAAASATLQSEVERLRADVAGLEGRTREGRVALEAAEKEAVELQLRVQRFNDESERSGLRSQVLEDELAGLQTEATELEAELQRVRAEAEAAQQTQQQLETELSGKTQQSERDLEALRNRMGRMTDLRAAEAASRERLESAEGEGRRFDDARNELEERLERVRGDAASAMALVEATGELIARTETELLQHLEQRKLHGSSIGELERKIAGLQEQLAREEGELGATRAAVEALREKTREFELARARAEADREHLDDLCLQELGVAASEARGPEGQEPAGDEEIDVEALDAEIDELKQRIDRLGPVNLTAIDEFSELEERHAFLAAQYDDLQKSIESLRETIRRINRESRQRFTEAFENIRKSYQEVFKLLFKGGRADLRLEEGEDVLECGIEILAQPPGKRLAGVHLMSGGEKALSAIALLFAIFRYQPSPFCLLDEVDAALDDSNVGRFTRMVSEYAKNTQFVIITHNKLSMEAADLLYGVTMEEPGVSTLVSLQLG
jgi:chromosome segregation protein